MIIYHNPRCRKSREGLAYIEEKGQKAEVREYLKEPISKSEMQDVLKKLDMQPSELLRKNEQIYKDQYKGKDITEDQWIDIMLEHPRLIERPIIVRENKAVVGRPKERIDELLQ